MTQRTNDAIARSDRVLIGVLAVILATVSAAVGASWNSQAAPAEVAQAAKPVATKVAANQQAPRQAVALPEADTAMAHLLTEHHCLSQALYYEARGEGAKGQEAVAEVVFHRMNSGNFGHSICAVVYEGAGHPGCQFSFTCNGDLKRAKNPKAWRKAEKLAAEILTDQTWRKNSTEGAINYHAVSVSPDWAPTLVKTRQIGNHIFYRRASHLRRS